MSIVEVGILGPLSARFGNVDLVSRAQQQRQVFTQLAIAAGRMVSVSDMCAELWDGNPPAIAVTVIQTYVVALRKQMARATVCVPGCTSVLVSGHSGRPLTVRHDRLSC